LPESAVTFAVGVLVQHQVMLQELIVGSGMNRRDFVAKYRVRVVGKYKVTYTLPKGISVLEMLQEAQVLSLRIYSIVAIYPSRLKKWSRSRGFSTKRTREVTMSINTAVRGSEFKTRVEQVRFLQSRGLRQVSAPFVAAAHAAFFVVSSRDLFDGHIIRCKGTKLYYGDGGLGEMGESDYINGCRYKNVKVAADVSHC
jgi:hypothetical protein